MATRLAQVTILGPPAIQNNATVWAYPASAFGVTPVQGTIPPTQPVASGITGSNGGGPGQAWLTLPDAAAYYAGVFYNNKWFWSLIEADFSAVTQKVRISNTYAVAGPLQIQSGATGYLPPFYAPVPSGQTATLQTVKASIRAGTSVTLGIQQNGVPIAGLTGIVVTTAPTVFTPTIAPAIADGDAIAVVLSSVSGSPDGLSLSIAFDVTV